MEEKDYDGTTQIIFTAKKTSGNKQGFAKLSQPRELPALSEEESEKAFAEVSRAMDLPVLSKEEREEDWKNLMETNGPAIKAALKMGPNPGDLGCD